MNATSIVVGGASGFWGEAPHAAGQLLSHPSIDYLVFDYLAEITMSIMARARQADPDKGYATDFVTDVMARHAPEIAARGVKVLANAGGVNPRACARALRAALDEAGIDLTVGVVEGDDLMAHIEAFGDAREMFSGAAFPATETIASANAYLGAFPVAAALSGGADIVITGRCADSALVLAACVHAFGWQRGDYDRLAAGSLAGHLIECGPQATGGNFTDWKAAGDLAGIGYPLAEISQSGEIDILKPAGTTGIVSPASVGEQLLYEIGDPSSYILPDVICDFAGVRLETNGPQKVRATGVSGRAPTGKYKVSLTYRDGFRAGYVFQMNGAGAREKAETYVRIGLDRARQRLVAMGVPDFDEVSIETFGGRPGDGPYEEITVKVAVRHSEARAVGLFLKEEIGAALATPPGLHFFTGGGRPKPSPVVRLFSFLIDAEDVAVSFRIGTADPVPVAAPSGHVTDTPRPHAPPQAVAGPDDPLRPTRLERLAWARSGDKGDIANVGVIARAPSLLPWIWAGLDEAVLRDAFAAELKGEVMRYALPGLHAMNIVMTQSLGGGGVASLLNDAQGKAFAQRVLDIKVSVPVSLIPGAMGDAS